MKQHKTILIAIFLISVLFRLYFAFQTPYFDYDSYFSLRQIEHIKETNFPIFKDSLSYSGREFIFIPTFHYILAFFSVFIPTTLIAKILPNLFASTLVFIIYLISKRITNNVKISLFASFISTFIPIFLSKTINSISTYSITIPLIFLAIYFFINLKDKKSINYFLLVTFLLTLIHSSAFLLVLGLLFYTAFTRVSKLKQQQSELEVILFSTFLVILLQFLIFREALVMHGLAVIWQNVPPSLLFSYFQKINIIEAILKIGLLPLIFGAYMIYKFTFRERNREIYILIGLATSTFLLLWLRLVQPDICLAIIGITLTLLFACFYKSFLLYLKKTRVSYLVPYISISFFLIFFLTSVFPAFGFSQTSIENSPSQGQVDALLWLRDNSQKHEIILASLKEGYLVNKIAQRKNIIDNNFLLIKNPTKILDEVEVMFTSPYKIDAIKLLTQYGVDYIFFSPQAKIQYKIDEIPYINGEDCFQIVYNESTKIYKNSCKIEVEKHES